MIERAAGYPNPPPLIPRLRPSVAAGEELLRALQQSLLGLLQVDEEVLLAHHPPRGVLVRDPRERELLLQHERLASVRRHDHLCVLRDGAQERHAEHLLDILHAHHVVLLDHVRADPVDDELHVVDVVSLEETGDAIGVADGGDLRRGDDDGLVGAGDGVDEANIDARGAVDEDVLEVHVLEDVYEQGHRILGDVVLLAILGNWEERERSPPLVADERLLHAALPLQHLHRRVHDSVLQAEQEVEVAEADVGVDEADLVAEPSDGHAEVGGGGGLADAALAAGDDDRAAALVGEDLLWVRVVGCAHAEGGAPAARAGRAFRRARRVGAGVCPPTDDRGARTGGEARCGHHPTL
mmetsp:Transcript_3353/g.13620  ORF Transcript_3353/g.13620 Transcript_3353/m.13620 type:complete len:353 (+) Transcript_3353:1688-2746(+)